MNDRDQLLKLARWLVLFMSLPVLCFIITAFALLTVGNISLASSLICGMFGWLAWTAFLSLRHLKRIESELS